MFGFDYTYMSSFEILEKMKKITEYGILEILLTLIGIILIFSLVFFIVPFIHNFLEKRKKEKAKKNKKALMDKIILQKNLEDIIARELKEKSDLIEEK